MAKWLRLETDMVDHPKTGRLAVELGDPLAGWYVVRALSWMSRFCPTGHVRDNNGTSLEASAQWRGTPGALLNALVLCGWLDVVQDGWVWHDWDEHQGKVARNASKERERKASYRARRGENTPGTSRGLSTGHPAQRDVTGRDVTGRNVDTDLASPATRQRTPKVEKPTDPRHHPLKLALLAAFEESQGSTCAFDGRQAKAVTRLLALGPDEEILRRWKAALAHKGFPTVRTPGELVTHWNHFAPASGEFAGTFLKEVLF